MYTNQKEAVRDFYGTIVGFIETNTTTGEAQARDFYGKILGSFDPKFGGRNGCTRDFYGKILGEGNQLSRLIWDPHYNKYIERLNKRNK